MPANRQDVLLKKLFEAVASRDRAAVTRLCTRWPEVASQGLIKGAERTTGDSWFFAAIGHWAYAGDTALHLAAAAHDVGIVKKLLTCGARVRARNRRGAEPIHYAADGTPGSRFWNPRAQVDVLRLLVESGADPSAGNDDGVAPIHRAVRTRCAAAVRVLLEYGVSVRSRNGTGSTPLHLAVQSTGRGGSGVAAARAEQAEIIRLLLARGARPSDEDRYGKTVRESVRAGWIQRLLD